MLFLMINFVMNNFAPNWIFKPLNENGNMPTVTLSQCHTVKDTSNSFIKNNKYTCRK